MDGHQATHSPRSVGDEALALREQAESLWQERAAGLPDSASTRLPPDTGHLLHELQVHQIELEMQNEQLRNAQRALEFQRSRYVDLYDLAPIAYCTLSDKGLFLQANLATASLFGLTRQDLAQWVFFRLVLKSDQHAWFQHCQQLISSGVPQTCQLRLIKADGTPFWAQLVSSLQPAPDGLLQQRVVISDISELKRLGLADRKAELARSLLQAQEQLKRRFSHDLHDRTSANLASLRLNLELIIATAPNSRDTQVFSDCAADTLALLEDTNTGIRNLCADLYPSVFELGGLSAALQSYARLFGQRTGVKVHMACSPDGVRLQADTELALFRIIQEALTNCAKHARAKHIHVSLQLSGWPVHLVISDDGIGFDSSATRLPHDNGTVAGQGLCQMSQTAEFLDGYFSLDSAPGRGTCIRVDIPQPMLAPQP